MLRLLADENFNHDIVRGLLLRNPKLAIVTVQNAGIGGIDDRDLLLWCAEHNRILLTHDQATMPRHAYERVKAGQIMRGVFVVNDRLPTGKIIDEIFLMDSCSQQKEWAGLVIYLPL